MGDLTDGLEKVIWLYIIALVGIGAFIGWLIWG